jgi:hypothetical protein
MDEDELENEKKKKYIHELGVNRDEGNWFLEYKNLRPALQHSRSRLSSSDDGIRHSALGL